jgi:hypothetical protein
VNSEMRACTITAGDPAILSQGKTVDGAFIPYGAVTVTVGAGGRVDVAGRLLLGPGSVIRTREPQGRVWRVWHWLLLRLARYEPGFVIEMAAALDPDGQEAGT